MTGAQRNQKMGRAVICTQIRLSPWVLTWLSRQLLSLLSASFLWATGDSKVAVGSAGVEGPCHQRIGQESLPGPAALAVEHGGGAGAGSRTKRAAGGQGASGKGRGDQNSRHVRVRGQASEIHHPKRI